jgi:type 2 lantibiotic biosynthesis protein LanM
MSSPFESSTVPLDRGLDFLEVLRPVIAQGYARLAEGLCDITGGAQPVAAPEVAASLLNHLLARLRWMVERTLILELNISRLEGRLEGESPEARFASFIESLRDPAEAGAILARYPVLAREAARHVEQWSASNLETLGRFAADRGEVTRRLFGGRDPGLVTALEPGRGDRHHGGRTVTILTFGSGRRLVYKPRSLAVDAWFQELLLWLNGRGADPQLLPLKVIDRGAHGWMELVEAASCASPRQIERFYERQGAWVALLYALEANDFHWENLIAAGEHPVLVDLETLFQPLPSGGLGEDPLSMTVLRTGLLPRGLRIEGLGVIDVSGLGATAGQKTPGRFPADPGTDRMRLAPAVLECPGQDNRPLLDGVPVALADHHGSVLRGFQALYRLLMKERDALLAEDGPLASCAGLETRFLLRNTTVYSHLAHNSYHPDFLQNELDRSRLFDRLWSEALHSPGLSRVVPDEISEMDRGDTPRFGAWAGSTSLRTGMGQVVEDFFAESGLARSCRRIAALGEEDLERQSAFIEASLNLARPAGTRLSPPREPLREEPGPADPDRLLAMATRLGRRLARLAIRDGGRVSWLHPDSQGLRPIEVDLYGGLAGIALFLAHLAVKTGDGEAEELARSALSTVRWRLDREPRSLPPLDTIGAFSGLGGALWTLIHLGLLWREPCLLDEAERMAGERLAQLVEEDRHFDLIGGAAGAIITLLALHRHRPGPSLLAPAIRCGEHLLSQARTEDGRMAWPPPPQGGDIPLTGLGHGAAGPAWALAALAKATDDERFEAGARSALAYERRWYSPERRNWPDLREDRKEEDGTHAFVQAWCHGAPGIGLGRLAMRHVLADAELEEEIRAAVISTRDLGFGGSQCLCHGDLGNLDLLLTAARDLGDPEMGAAAGRLAAGILARLESRGPRCGGRVGEEIPGLMTGLAGIGYGLLRAADPERVPSVLLLELPA